MTMTMREMYQDARRWLRDQRREVRLGRVAAPQPRHWDSWSVANQESVYPCYRRAWEEAYRAAEKTMQLCAGTTVTTGPLESTTGMLIAPEALARRREGATGALHSYVPGHGGDVWWVRHDDGSTAPYCYTELSVLLGAK